MGIVKGGIIFEVKDYSGCQENVPQSNHSLNCRLRIPNIQFRKKQLTGKSTQHVISDMEVVSHENGTCSALDRLELPQIIVSQK